MSSVKVRLKSAPKVNKAVLNRIKKLVESKLKVGFMDDKEHGGRFPGSNAALAFIQDTGVGHIPSRPFMTTTLGQKAFVKPRLSRFAPLLLKNPTVAMDRIGGLLVEDVKTTMDAWSTPRNTDETIRKKKADNPLIETGSLRDSVEHKITKKGEDQ